MTHRERILAVYNGRTPDRVPFMLDLSHYYYHRFNKPWDLCNGYDEPDREMIDFSREFGAGFYCPQQAIISGCEFTGGVVASTAARTVDGEREIVWRFDTPYGSIERVRVWERQSYSWAIKKWGVTTEDDLKILGYALSHRKYIPMPDKFAAWDAYVGDNGVPYLGVGYSAMGQLLNYWMGVENTLYASYDWNETMHEVVSAINENQLDMMRMYAAYPADVIIMGDNFSSDIQPPSYFDEWSRDYYTRAIDILHDGGKKVAVHVDGRLRGAISMIGACGADCIDAVTPKPTGDLTPAQCRAEAGDKLILSGGISPELFLAGASDEEFEAAVRQWLALKNSSPALILAAGDQVPPGTLPERLHIMKRLSEELGGY